LSIFSQFQALGYILLRSVHRFATTGGIAGAVFRPYGLAAEQSSLCGFVGLFNPAGLACESSAAALVADMRDTLDHRGPDDAGLWLDPVAGIALGSRRLAIVDLSPAGHQPMLSADGRWVLALNGEIYNAADIRSEIAAASPSVSWRGHSDTEVLLEGIASWGLEATLQRANGMFALAVWDRRDRTLFLARDRIGKKPLYYGWAGGYLIFGSELKALWRHPDFDTAIDRTALTDFLRLGYVLGSRSIFAGTWKLPAGQLLAIDCAGAARRAPPISKAYWDRKEVAFRGLDARESGNHATTDELDALLRDAVGIRMLADVPVGGLLSGGIDSSLIVALMAENAPGPIDTYSVGFDVPAWDESHYAREVARHLGTRHHETPILAADVLALMQDLPAIFDEPLADDSMIPTALLSRAARRDVTVALSGDGGDELFAGYDRYSDAARWLTLRRAMPSPVRWLAAVAAARVGRPVAGILGWNRIDRRLRLLSELLSDDTAEHFSAAIVSHSLDPNGLASVPGDTSNPLMAAAYCLGRGTDIDRFLFMDGGSFLIDDILAKVDRASMAASLEVRCPLLDHRIIEMSWRFPASEKTDGSRGKLPLRRILQRYVPASLMERPKMGFNAPVQIWLLGTLRDWAEALLSREALSRHGLLNVDTCRRVWEDFSVRGRSYSPLIWSLLMFQAWHRSMTAATAVRHSGIARLLLAQGRA
jgi:asparagine synthase (glutamine-hydrolysing)